MIKKLLKKTLVFGLVVSIVVGQPANAFALDSRATNWSSTNDVAENELQDTAEHENYAVAENELQDTIVLENSKDGSYTLVGDAESVIDDYGDVLEVSEDVTEDLDLENTFAGIVIEKDSLDYSVDGQAGNLIEEYDLSKEEACDLLDSREAVADFVSEELEEHVYEVAEYENSYLVTAPFQTKQLLVESCYVDDVMTCYKVATKKDQLVSRWNVLSEEIDAYSGALVLTFEEEEDASEALEDIRKRFGEEACIPNMPLFLMTDETQEEDFVDEPQEKADAEEDILAYQATSWGNTFMGMDQLKSEALPAGAAKEILVSVIDTGVDKDHSFFAGGRISSKSKNFADSKNSFADTAGHGTHVCGIIADATPANVKIMMCKIMKDSGSVLISTVVDTINYSINQGAEVINMSLAFDGFTDIKAMDLVDAYITKAYINGVVICAAAGNQGRKAIAYPASNSKTLAISALDENSKLAVYSNYGSSITFTAPGSNIVSAQAKKNTIKESGTSMAAPHIAAACAYVKLLNPDLTVSGVAGELKKLCLDLGSSGKDERYGYGCPIMKSLFDDGLADPDNIILANVLSVKNQSSKVKVSWSGVKDATKYKVYRKVGSNSYSCIATVSSSNTSYTDKKVSNGKKYTYRILPVNDGKTGVYGKSKQTVFVSRLSGLKLSSPSTDKVKVSWKKKSSISGIQIALADNKNFEGAEVVSAKKSDTKKTISNLPYDKAYVRMRAYKTVSGTKYYSDWTDPKSLKVK